MRGDDIASETTQGYAAQEVVEHVIVASNNIMILMIKNFRALSLFISNFTYITNVQI